jgi:hypothetical protein
MQGPEDHSPVDVTAGPLAVDRTGWSAGRAGSHEPLPYRVIRRVALSHLTVEWCREARRQQLEDVPEVRAALGALSEVMHLKAVRGETASLAPPTGAGHDLSPGLAGADGTAAREALLAALHSREDRLPPLVSHARPAWWPSS